MENPTPKTPIELWISRNYTKILIGVIIYQFGVNQGQQDSVTLSEERANLYQNKFESHIKLENEAANRIAFRALLRSDTGLAHSFDSLTIFPFGAIIKDTTGRP